MNKYDNNSKSKKECKTFTDYEIFKGKIRLIRAGQAPIVMERDSAIELAKAEGKNLVQVAYNKNDFPHSVCKIIDFSKFKYEQKKKDKAAKKAAKAAAGELKEISFSIRIDDNDKKIKIDHIRQFLQEKNTRVKIIVRLSRREMNLIGMAKDLLRSVCVAIDDLAVLDGNPTFMSGIMSCVVKAK